MEIVIDIPEYVYDMTRANNKVIYADSKIVGEAIKNGISLPKGHGKLIDADKAVADYKYYGISHMWDATDLEDIMDECTAIIKADKEET